MTSQLQDASLTASKPLHQSRFRQNALPGREALGRGWSR